MSDGLLHWDEDVSRNFLDYGNDFVPQRELQIDIWNFFRDPDDPIDKPPALLDRFRHRRRSAAGTPHAVFCLQPADLLKMSQGKVISIL